MVTGPLRAVLWFLSGLGVVWVGLVLALLPGMSRMMGSGGMMQGGTRHGGMMEGGMMAGAMMPMMAMIAVQLVAMLGLVAIFLYLVVDSLRARSASKPRSLG